MNKVIVVSYTDGDFDSYLKVYTYSPAIIEKFISDLKNYLNEEFDAVENGLSRRS